MHTHTHTPPDTFARFVHLAGRMMRHRHTILMHLGTSVYEARIQPPLAHRMGPHLREREREKASIFMKLLPAAIVENFLVRET